MSLSGMFANLERKIYQEIYIFASDSFADFDLFKNELKSKLWLWDSYDYTFMFGTGINSLKTDERLMRWLKEIYGEKAKFKKYEAQDTSVWVQDNYITITTPRKVFNSEGLIFTSDCNENDIKGLMSLVSTKIPLGMFSL